MSLTENLYVLSSRLLLHSGMTSVYTFGPTFRANHSHTRRHLAEFYMVEAETVTLGETDAALQVLMELIENLLSWTAKCMWERNAEDMELLSEISAT